MEPNSESNVLDVISNGHLYFVCFDTISSRHVYGRSKSTYIVLSLFGSNHFRMHLCMRKSNRRITLLLNFAS
jgi:hypothetical protein